jgi:hypothetical protein
MSFPFPLYPPPAVRATLALAIRTPSVAGFFGGKPNPDGFSPVEIQS